MADSVARRARDWRPQLSVWRRMWPAVVLGAAIMSLVAWRAATSPSRVAPLWELSGSGPWVGLTLVWLLAPEMAIALSAPLARRDLVLSAEQCARALRYAVRHWRYFDRFGTAETHWLVPDNFQETPLPVVASRLTGIGLQLRHVSLAIWAC